jgi:lipopolysaccharide/colanic/teichoic acid biosynthesis glycosyltransferase
MLPKAGSPQRAKQRIPADHPPAPRNHTIVGEHEFVRMLALERKRADRSRKQFALALVDARRATHAGRAESVVQTVVSALLASTRETDLIGRYGEGVVGVIFTEMGNESRPVAATFVEKIQSALRGVLPSELIGKIDVSLHVYPSSWDKQDGEGPADLIFYPDLSKRRFQSLPRILKRVMDVVGSLAALILCSPLLLIISLLIKLTSKGSVIYRQERVGQFGKRFQLLKFRSMYDGNDPSIHREYVKALIAEMVESGQSNGSEDPVYKLTQDPRITPIGRFLRKTSLDETPQFWNVLKGEMSLVGPRPPIHYEVLSYDIWHRRRIFEAQPGITGLWQVSGRSRMTFNEMVRLDLQYARTWSLGLDMKILLRTPRAVLSGSGAC